MNLIIFCFSFLLASSLSASEIALPEEKIDFSSSLHELETRGFTILDNLFSEEEIKDIAARFQTAKDKALKIIESSPPVVRYFSENNMDNKTQYWKTENEIVLQAGAGRYDFFKGFSKDLMASVSDLPYRTLEALMQQLMVDEFTHYSGIVYSQPGSEDQYWHRDTHTLEHRTSEGTHLVDLDDFYFTVLIPITVPFTIENGTTEFMAGSHKLPAKKFDQCALERLEVPLGSALVFNGKINHRGKANLSSEDRPAFYIVYHKKWYNDQYRKGVLD
jgi:hypothetical protein